MTSPLVRASAAALLLASLVLAAVVALRPDRGLLDFGAFYMAGVAREQGLDPYGVYPELAAETGQHFGHTDGRGHSPNLNPPISLYPFSLLPDLDPEDAKAVLNATSALVFAACAVALLRTYPQHRTVPGVLWVLGFGGFWYTLWLGQVYVFLFAAAVGAWLLLQRGERPIAVGLLIGVLVAVKPHFALWALFLLLAGQRRAGLTALGVAAVISAVPLVLEGPDVYRQWLAAVDAYPRVGLGGNASVVGLAERLGFAPAGYVVGATLVAAAALVVWRLRPPASTASAWAITVSLVAAPISWIGYALVAMPVLMIRRWSAPEWVAAAGMSGVWFALGRGEAFLAASVILLGLLARDALMAVRPAEVITHTREAGAVQEQVAA